VIDPSKIEKIMALMNQYGIDVVETESGEEKISLARQSADLKRSEACEERGAGLSFHPSSSLSNALPTSSPSLQERESLSSSKPISSKEEGANLAIIQSPFVGTFYRSPSPDAAAFVEVGAHIKKGQTLCIVEAMKLMNEIEADFDAQIVEILHDNGKPVEFGTDLFRVKVLSK
jgi:acetyl-CoA carboxylase biotin carboxyl carrier protein